MKNLKYNIISIITLVLPMSVYLFVSAVFFNITPDIIINKEIGEVFVKEMDDEYFVYGTNDTTYIGGYVIFYEGNYGAVIDGETIVKLGSSYYQFNGQSFVNVKLIRQAEDQAFKLPIAFFISAIGAFIVALIVIGKMKVLKDYPRESVLVTLVVLTLVFYILDLIVSNLKNVFTVSTLSWAIYYIEYLIHRGNITKKEGDFKVSELTKQLAKYNEELK